MKAFLLFINIALITVAAFAAAPVFKTHAEVRDENIELGEIAFVETKELQEIVLDKSPQIGETIVWNASELSKKLRPYEEILKNIQIKLPQLIKITRVDLAFSQVALEQKIKEAIRVLTPKGWEVELVEIQKPHWPVVTSKARWHVVTPSYRPKGASQYEIIVQDDGQTPKRIWVNARTQYFTEVLVAQNNLSAREKILAENIKSERREVTHLADTPIKLDEAQEALAKFNIQPGTILTKNMFDKEYAVKFGEEIEVRVGNENFSVISKAIAQQNAHIGDLIKMRTNQNTKTISGTVIGKRLVKVNL